MGLGLGARKLTPAPGVAASNFCQGGEEEEECQRGMQWG